LRRGREAQVERRRENSSGRGLVLRSRVLFTDPDDGVLSIWVIVSTSLSTIKMRGGLAAEETTSRYLTQGSKSWKILSHEILPLYDRQTLQKDFFS